MKHNNFVVLSIPPITLSLHSHPTRSNRKVKDIIRLMPCPSAQSKKLSFEKMPNNRAILKMFFYNRMKVFFSCNQILKYCAVKCLIK